MGRVRIVARKNGPYQVFVDGKLKAVLCRCGRSKKKPFCDGSHARVGFEAEEYVLEFD
ncbi:MAG: CDGSH iron-sulfur domain-containing protein [Desulfurococcales archaeon]|nr:CDGSH iron-sulfur domain-containing protein [Desulfurococcales archaeon]